MHSVSPVHIRVENHVKTPMVATNFEDLMGKSKKRVKIGSSTVFKSDVVAGRVARPRSRRQAANNELMKSKSLSPKPWCPPPGKTTKSTQPKQSQSNQAVDLMRTCRLSEYDHIPVRETNNSENPTTTTKPTCTVCSSKSRSRSRSLSPHSSKPSLTTSRSSPESTSSSIMPIFKQHPNTTINLNTNNNNSNCNRRRRRCPNSLSPASNRSSSTSSLYQQQRRSRSWDDGTVRGGGGGFDKNADYIAPKREFLVEKLVETEAYANEIAKHFSYVKDYLKLETSDLIANSAYVVRQFDADRNRLLELIDLFGQASDDLKSAIYDLTSPKSMQYFRSTQENQFLVKQIDALEIENNNLKKMLLQFEKNSNHSGTANEALNIENNVLTNIRMCLEDNRAHLRRQLNSKESEINRLNVQLRNLNRKLDRSQIEIELLRENRQRIGLAPLKIPATTTSTTTTTTTITNNPSKSNLISTSSSLNPTTKPIKLTKRYYNLEEILADPIKIRLYVEKLNKQLREKDSLINNLNEALTAKETNELERISKISSETRGNLEAENERLKKIAKSKEDKLRTAEIKLNLLEKQHQKEEQSPSKIERTKNFAELELDNVRSRLQKRLNELEPLPELLKNTELKLHEALFKLNKYEAECSEYRRIIEKLKNNENDEVKKKKAKKSNSAIIENLTIIPPPQTSMIVDDRRSQSMERSENRELLRQLAAKDDLVRDLTSKLAHKANEASSYSRQLDLALSDAKARNQQQTEAFNSKERMLQLKCNELESRLNSLDFHSNVDRKDKDNMAHDYLNQIRDLKAKLEQAQLTNKQMQEYVNFLKNSYITYFNDQTIFDSSSNNNNPLIGSGSSHDSLF